MALLPLSLLIVAVAVAVAVGSRRGDTPAGRWRRAWLAAVVALLVTLLGWMAFMLFDVGPALRAM